MSDLDVSPTPFTRPSQTQISWFRQRHSNHLQTNVLTTSYWGISNLFFPDIKSQTEKDFLMLLNEWSKKVVEPMLGVILKQFNRDQRQKSRSILKYTSFSIWQLVHINETSLLRQTSKNTHTRQTESENETIKKTFTYLILSSFTKIQGIELWKEGLVSTGRTVVDNLDVTSVFDKVWLVIPDRTQCAPIP
jgi:hypothetical protein